MDPKPNHDSASKHPLDVEAGPSNSVQQQHAHFSNKQLSRIKLLRTIHVVSYSLVAGNLTSGFMRLFPYVTAYARAHLPDHGVCRWLTPDLWSLGWTATTFYALACVIVSISTTTGVVEPWVRRRGWGLHQLYATDVLAQGKKEAKAGGV